MHLFCLSGDGIPFRPIPTSITTTAQKSETKRRSEEEVSHRYVITQKLPKYLKELMLQKSKLVTVRLINSLVSRKTLFSTTTLTFSSGPVVIDSSTSKLTAKNASNPYSSLPTTTTSETQKHYRNDSKALAHWLDVSIIKRNGRVADADIGLIPIQENMFRFPSIEGIC